jgi:transposase
VTIALKEEELERIIILRQVQERKMTQVEAGQRLDLSVRQIYRLLHRLKVYKTCGVKNRHRGGNNAFTPDFKKRVLALIQEKYHDFGPTFAAEKLRELDGLFVNHETLRQWMTEAGLWQAKARKTAHIHQIRERRPRFGELVQIDGSPHDWFEGRAEKCCLLVFIDDATSQIITARFEKSETTLGYMRCVQTHIQTHGCPISYYSDRHSIFKTTRNACIVGRFEDTQFHRALKQLGIGLICAHSPQAKGRVEMANQTLQDRLVKEMRLRGISSIEEGNVYLPEFIEKHKAKLALRKS